MGQPGLPRLGNATPSVRQSLRCRNVNVAFCFATDCTGGLDQRKERENSRWVNFSPEGKFGDLFAQRSVAWGDPLALAGGCPLMGLLEILSLKDVK